MVDQRRGECAGERRGGSRGVGGVGLVLLALTLLLAGCNAGSPVAPGNLSTPGGGTTGTSGGGGSNAPVVGTWQASILTSLPPDDYLQATTTWTFRADATCEQSVVTLLYSEGFSRSTIRSCTYQLNQGVVLVRYDGAAGEVSYPFSKPLNDPNTLVLSGTTYGRIS